MSLSRSASALIATLLALLNGCATGTAARHDVGPVGESPLHVAAMTGRRDVVQGLLDQGAAVDMRGSGGLAGSSLRDVTPLHLAALYGHEPVIRLLLARGAHPNARASNGMTP
jgi:ankyrin repeat protein